MVVQKQYYFIPNFLREHRYVGYALNVQNIKRKVNLQENKYQNKYRTPQSLTAPYPIPFLYFNFVFSYINKNISTIKWCIKNHQNAGN